MQFMQPVERDPLNFIGYIILWLCLVRFCGPRKKEMGLLTDPNAGHGKLIKLLIRYYTKVCFLLYVGGIVWFCLLAHPPINQGTYYSENALLAGLVKTEFREQNDAKIYYEELIEEIKKYDDTLPYPWLLAKFRQTGLDTYTHNFTLNYPLGSRQKYSGKNVYAILRAPRAASTEALVMSVPYRHPLSVHLPTNPAIAIMLAFAKFATRGQYWSKDIIFLITEHEQLGVQAWLESYHGISCGKEGVLDYGEMNGRAGAIQAAINLEFHDVNIGRIDVKIEGLNGQLPNLDLFNLATRMCSKENVAHTFKNRPLKFFNDPLKHWWYSMKTMLAMVTTQATGVPNGNHGLFYRFGIQALTLEGFAPNGKNQYKHGFISLGRILEQIFRSLNNLLERFHQSYFFYLLPSSSRFVSIGLYIPSICLIAAVLFIKSYAIWFKLNVDKGYDAEVNEEDLKALEKEFRNVNKEIQEPTESYDNLTEKDWKEMFKEEIESDKDNDDNLDLGYIAIIFIGAHIIGFLFKQMPPFLTSFGNVYAYNTDITILVGLGIASLVLSLVPCITKRLDYHSSVMLNILCLLELGTTIICVSMYNFSLGLIIGIIYVPFAFIMQPSHNSFVTKVQKFLWLLVHPLVLVAIIVLISTFITFPEEQIKTILLRGVGGTQHALTYSILDSMIYGSWFYSATCCVFLPNWFCYWYLTFVKSKDNVIDRSDVKLKNE